MDILTFESRTRNRSQAKAQIFYDFVVSGSSLFDQIGHQYDFVSPFGDLLYRKQQNDIRKQLLLEKASELGGKWVPLFVCGECGDSGCGLVSVKIVKDGEIVIWSDFRYEDENHPDAVDWEWSEPLVGVGPYRFSFKSYRDALMSLEVLS